MHRLGSVGVRNAQSQQDADERKHRRNEKRGAVGGGIGGAAAAGASDGQHTAQGSDADGRSNLTLDIVVKVVARPVSAREIVARLAAWLGRKT